MTLTGPDRSSEMTAAIPKSDISSQLAGSEERQIQLKNRIETLERLLHGELTKRSDLEFELYQIKNSLAWKFLLNYRSLRDKLLGDGTLRLTCYELARDL